MTQPHITVNDYRVRIVDEKNRINELIEECTYDIVGVTHIDMNEFAERLINETVAYTQLANFSGMNELDYVKHKMGIV
jgi:hypothetical protein